METMLADTGSWLGLLGTVGLLLATNVARKYVIPFLRIGQRQKYAEFIGKIADEVTDDLRAKYPEKLWLKHLDEAIDRLISICEISPEIAKRAINASLGRFQTSR